MHILKNLNYLFPVSQRIKKMYAVEGRDRVEYGTNSNFLSKSNQRLLSGEKWLNKISKQTYYIHLVYLLQSVSKILLLIISLFALVHILKIKNKL